MIYGCAMIIDRQIAKELLLLKTEYPVVTILGPRQSGKTTLAKHALAGYEYSNLEIPEVRELASRDPKAYLKQFKGPVILDEIQRVPDLLSYIQASVDTNPEPGRFVLTGSHQLMLRQSIGQSLAGRTALLTLLPFSVRELDAAGLRFDRFEEYAHHGFLPRIYDRSMRPTTAYSNYYQTYVERDVRQLINLKDASAFEKMMKLLAGRAGRLLNMASLASDVGVDSHTIRAWLSVLEASFLVFRLPPYFENFGKRVIKSAKYYFTDVGLLCFLLGIRTPEQITRDPLVGSIFENLVVVEVLKARLNRGLLPDLYFYRDSNGNEVDLLLPDARKLHVAEIKSASTFSWSLIDGLRRFQALTRRCGKALLIYNGAEQHLSEEIQAIGFRNADRLLPEDEDPE